MDRNGNILDDQTLEKICVALLERNATYLEWHCANACNGDTRCADDLMQDIFCAVWRSRHTIRQDCDKRQLDNWLRAKTRTVTHDFLRIHRVKWISIDTHHVDPASDDNPFNNLDNLADNKIIATLLRPLNARETKLIYLWLEGYTQEEIAKMNNVSASAMRKRFSRMFDKIKKYTNEHHIDREKLLQ